jgi:hypothetical protein
MGYPSSVEQPDGSFVTVYYWIDKDGVRFIEAALWRAM